MSIDAATEGASCPLDWRLFIPEEWDEDSDWNKERREKTKLPEDVHHVEKWRLGSREPTKYWLSNLPGDTELKQLVRFAKMRWRIEQDYRELKDALGLDHFEGRTYRGWNHPRQARLGRAGVPHPAATTAPSSQGGSLTLFGIVRELQALLACWQGTCPVCRRELPPDHHLRVGYPRSLVASLASACPEAGVAW